MTQLFTDTSANLPVEIIDVYGIEVVPFSYTIDGVEYIPEREFDGKAFYAAMRAGSEVKTSMVNAGTFIERFKAALDAGKDILCISFSSALSTTYQSACIAAEDLRAEHPEAKIIVIDSLCASMGEGLFVHKAVMMKEEGKSIDEIAAWLEENKLHVVHNFTVDDLFHLYRGGRVSKTAAVVGSMINLKPILHVDNEGHLIPLSKVRGRKKSLIALVDSMEKQIGAWRDKNDIVFISHGDSLEDAQFVAELIKKRLGIENFLINHIGPTIGAHSGPGTIALFYMGDYR